MPYLPIEHTHISVQCIQPLLYSKSVAVFTGRLGEYENMECLIYRLVHHHFHKVKCSLLQHDYPDT